MVVVCNDQYFRCTHTHTDVETWGGSWWLTGILFLLQVLSTTYYSLLLERRFIVCKGGERGGGEGEGEVEREEREEAEEDRKRA